MQKQSHHPPLARLGAGVVNPCSKSCCEMGNLRPRRLSASGTYTGTQWPLASHSSTTGGIWGHPVGKKPFLWATSSPEILHSPRREAGPAILPGCVGSEDRERGCGAGVEEQRAFKEEAAHTDHPSALLTQPARFRLPPAARAQGSPAAPTSSSSCRLCAVTVPNVLCLQGALSSSSSSPVPSQKHPLAEEELKALPLPSLQPQLKKNHRAAAYLPLLP